MKKVNIIQIQKSKINKNNCNILLVPKEVCYIKFGKSKDKVSYSIDNIDRRKNRRDLYTIRDEMVVLDLNNKDKIIGIELIESSKAKKPCMSIK